MCVCMRRKTIFCAGIPECISIIDHHIHFNKLHISRHRNRIEYLYIYYLNIP